MTYVSLFAGAITPTRVGLGCSRIDPGGCGKWGRESTPSPANGCFCCFATLRADGVRVCVRSEPPAIRRTTGTPPAFRGTACITSSGSDPWSLMPSPVRGLPPCTPPPCGGSSCKSRIAIRGHSWLNRRSNNGLGSRRHVRSGRIASHTAGSAGAGVLRVRSWRGEPWRNKRHRSTDATGFATRNRRHKRCSVSSACLTPERRVESHYSL